MNDNEFNAAIKLLDDPDVAEIVEQQIVSQGTKIIGRLREVSQKNYVQKNSDVVIKMDKIIDQIYFSHIIDRLKGWVGNSSNLLEGAWLVSQVNYPKIDFKYIESQMSTVYDAVVGEYCKNYSPLERIRVMNYVFYKKLKFHSNNSEMYSPCSSLINKVFEYKQGNTVTMAILYGLMLQKVGLPVYCVNMPKNFLLAYTAEECGHPEEVIFYINPYNKGMVLSRKEIDFFLKLQKIKPSDEYIKPCNNITTIQRLVCGLKFAYSCNEDIGNFKRMEEVEKVFPQQLAQGIEWN